MSSASREDEITLTSTRNHKAEFDQELDKEVLTLKSNINGLSASCKHILEKYLKEIGSKRTKVTNDMNLEVDSSENGRCFHVKNNSNHKHQKRVAFIAANVIQASEGAGFSKSWLKQKYYWAFMWKRLNNL